MKKLMGLVLIFIITLFSNIQTADAKTYATLKVDTQDEIIIGDIFNVDIKLQDITEDSVVALAAKLNYDKNNLELVSYNLIKDPYQLAINKEILKFGGISTDGIGITNNKTIATFTFKALKESTNNLYLTEVDVVDSNALRVTTNTINKNIIIEEKERETTKKVETINTDKVNNTNKKIRTKLINNINLNKNIKTIKTKNYKDIILDKFYTIINNFFKK